MPDEPGNTKSSENAHPRRAAARKAAKLAAEQLESSPIPSDAENDAGVSFRGEPSTPRSGVTKFTYGGKRKYMQSPLKSSPSSCAGPSGTRPRSKSLIEESPGKQKNGSGRGRGSSRRHEGRQTKRTRRRSFPRSSSVENDSAHFSDPENTHDNPGAKEASQTQAKAPSTTDKPDETAAGHHATDKQIKKRPLSSSSMSSNNDGSLLTPLYSPEATRSGGARPMPVLAPRLARQFMRSKTLSGLTLGSPNKPNLKPAKSFDDLLLLDSTDEESFDELDVGNFGWVSIDLQGNLADADEDGDTLWWPAKVTFPRPCMRVLLIGNPPGEEVSGQRQLDIPEPTPSNVCSLLQNGRIRFTDTDYRPSQHSVQSPRKRRKLNLDEAWREARNLMVEADSAQNEGRPFSLSAAKAGQASSSAVKRTNEPFPSLAPSKTKAKGEGKGKGKSVDLSHIDLDAGLSESRPETSWRPPGPDPLLDIPGELVLARDSKARMQYWPAKLLEYIPPQNSRHKPKYKTLFFDGTIKSIDPEWFWTMADVEFSTCKLGESTGNYGLDSDVDSSDDEDEDFNRPFAAEDDTKLRAPSPLPSLPAPPPEEFEYDLTMSEQFAYVKPVLAAVIEGKYGPARHRHEDFMRGAGARRKILDDVPVRGSLSARDKEEVAYLVRSWARRRERRQEMGLDVEYPSDKLYPCPGGEVGHANGHDEDRVNNDGHEKGDDDRDDARSAQSAASDVSGGDTEPLAPFDAEPPPSSFAATEIETDEDERDKSDVFASLRRDEDDSDPVYETSATFTAENPTSYGDARLHNGSAAPIVAAAGGAERTADETLRAPPRTTFHDLDAVEKITYCNNVLLQEAVLQLLLWRTGQRKALGLLAPEEEERLHRVAEEEGAKTSWVHEIIFMRQAAENTMLPSFKDKDKDKGKASEGAPTGRTRARRGVGV